MIFSITWENKPANMHRMLQRESINQATQKSIEFCAIWDVYGDFSLAMDRLRNACDNGVELWRSPVIFMGDIIGDRYHEGLRILSHIDLLRRNTPSENRDALQYIIGNHDLWALMFLADSLDAQKYPQNEEYRESRINFYTGLLYGWNEEEVHRQCQGMMEFLDFLPVDKLSISPFSPDVVRHLFMNGPKIIANMRNSDFWQAAIREICASKLCSRVNNTLFIHTPPTQRSMAELARYGFDIEAMNRLWQSCVQNIFAKNPKETDPSAYFENLFETFLDPANRFKNEKDHPSYGAFSPSQAEALKEHGIERIVFWHDPVTPEYCQMLDGIEMVWVDYGSANSRTFIQKKPKIEWIFEKVLRIIQG